MKDRIKINGIIIVEGTSDVNYLSSFIDAEFLITNGSEISRSTLDAIKALKEKGHNIIVFTDPDFPGKKIRDTINAYVNGCYNCFINKSDIIKEKKIGVAEASKESIIKSLQNLHIFNKTTQKDDVTYSKLVETGFLNLPITEFKKYIAHKYSFDETNTKTFIKRINQLNINIKEEIINYGRK